MKRIAGKYEAVKKLLVKLKSIDSPGKLDFILATNDIKDFVFVMSSE